MGEVSLGNVTPKDLVHMVGREEIKTGPLCQKIRALPTEEKALLAQNLKQEWMDASGGSATWRKKDFEPYLAAVGDIETIDMLIGRFQKTGRDINALRISGNPAVITRMGEHLLGDNSLRDKNPGNDSPPMGIADGTWKICRSILLAAPEFSSELKAWAEISTESVGWSEPDGLPNEHLSAIRQWWNQNRAAFQAGEFSKVKPGGVLASWQQASDSKGEQAPARTNSGATSGAASVPKPPPAVVPSDAEPEQMPFRNYAFYAAVATLLLVTVFIFRNRLFQRK